MFELSYRISEKSRKEESTAGYDLLEATETDFDYSDIFVGDLIIKNEDTDLSALWDWVPILYVMTGISEAYVTLSGNKWALVDFTENAEQIHLERNGSKVSISTSYSSGVIVVDYDEFGKLAVDFMEKSLKDLKKIHPKTKRNQTIKTYDDKLRGLKIFYKRSVKNSRLVR